MVLFNPPPLTPLIFTELHSGLEKRRLTFETEARNSLLKGADSFVQLKNVRLESVRKFLKPDSIIFDILSFLEIPKGRRSQVLVDVKWQRFTKESQTTCIPGYHLDTYDSFDGLDFDIYRPEIHHIFAITDFPTDKTVGMTAFSTLPWELSEDDAKNVSSLKTEFERARGELIFEGEEPTFSLPPDEGSVSKLIVDSMEKKNRRVFEQYLPQGTWLTYSNLNFHRGYDKFKQQDLDDNNGISRLLIRVTETDANIANFGPRKITKKENEDYGYVK